MQLSLAARRLVGYAIACGVVELGAWAALVATGDLPAEQRALVRVIAVLVLGLAGLAVVVGLLISAIAWLVAAAREARAQGRAANRLIGGYGIGAFVGLFALGFFEVPGGVYSAVAIRLLAVAVLIAGVRHTTAALRRGAGPRRPYAEEPPMIPRPTAEDWDASVWDPDVQRDIERRRHRQGR